MLQTFLLYTWQLRQITSILNCTKAHLCLYSHENTVPSLKFVYHPALHLSTDISGMSYWSYHQDSRFSNLPITVKPR